MFSGYTTVPIPSHSRERRSNIFVALAVNMVLNHGRQCIELVQVVIRLKEHKELKNSC